MCLTDNFITTLYHSDGDSRMHIDGEPLLSLCGISSFSEYSVIRETQLAKV
jgi:Zn-dependent alcohol dehydrogenase